MIARTALHGPSGGMIAGAAALGFLTGIFANMGRKAAMQAMEGIGGDWVDVLKTEHKAVRRIFDRIEATRTEQTTRRAKNGRYQCRERGCQSEKISEVHV